MKKLVMTEEDLIPVKDWKKRLKYVTDIFNRALKDIDVSESEQEIIRGMCSEYANSFYSTASVKVLRQIYNLINAMLKKYGKDSSKQTGKVDVLKL